METIKTPAKIYTPPAGTVTYEVNLYLGDAGMPPVINLMQYDDTIPVVAAKIFYNGMPYKVPDGAAVNIREEKPDGKHVYNPVLGISSDRSTAYIAITHQMTAADGQANTCIEVYKGGILGTSLMTLNIQKNPVPENAIASTDEYKTMQELHSEVVQSAESVKTDAGKAETAATKAEAAANRAERAECRIDDSTTSTQTTWSSAKNSLDFAGAFKNQVSSEMVVVDDASPVEHEVRCRAENLNLVNSENPKIIYRSNLGTNYPTVGRGNGTIDFGGLKGESDGGFVVIKTIPGHRYTFSGHLNVSGLADASTVAEIRSFAFIPEDNILDGKRIFEFPVKNQSFAESVVADDTWMGIDFYSFGTRVTQVTNFMVNVGDSMLPYTPYVPDLSKVTVSRYGKNLLNNKEMLTESNWLVSSNSTLDYKSYFVGRFSPGTVLHYKMDKNLFANNPSTDTIICFRDKQSDIWSPKYPIAHQSGSPLLNPTEGKITVGKTGEVWISFYRATQMNLLEFSEYCPNLRLGVSTGDYELFIPPQSINPSPSGEVRGMTSLSPGMTILSDTPGVIINAEYNLDGKKYIDKKVEELKSAVLSLGGNI